jgi:hypothetical protein
MAILFTHFEHGEFIADFISLFPTFIKSFLPQSSILPDIEARQCSRRFTVNGPTLHFCCSYDLELTEEAANKVKQAKKEAELQPEEYQAIFDRFKAELLQMQNAKKVKL